MNINRIQPTLQNLFQDDSRWAHRGQRVVFWYDPDQQFQDTFADLALDGVEKLQLNDTPFTVKHRLLIEQPQQAFLLYAPFPEPDPQDNWLLDIQHRALTFSADRAALIFADLGLRQRRLETQIRQHLKFFDSRKRTEALQAMQLSPQTDELGLLQAMLSVLAGLKVPDANSLIRRVLMAGLLETDNAIWSDITRFVSASAFWQTVQNYLGVTDATPSLNKLFVRLLITHFDTVLHGHLPPSLQPHVITPGQPAYAFIDQWQRDQQDSPKWMEWSELIQKELDVFPAIEHIAPDLLFEATSFEAVDYALIRTCTQEIKAQAGDLNRWRTWFKARQSTVWYAKYEEVYQALAAAIDLVELKHQYSSGFRLSAPQLFQAYASDLYQFDRAYRRFIVASDHARGDIIKNLVEEIENLYTYWFLDSIGAAWSDALEAQAKGHWQISGIPSQVTFFQHNVIPILERNDREKVFVIISDALRHEVASELKEAIAQDLRGDTQLTPQLGVLPSITRLGMAALLPGATLELIPSDTLKDGLSTKGLDARLAVLQHYKDPQNKDLEATVLRAADLLAMNTDMGREAIKPHRLIYIYHDVIDAIGDKAASERQVLAACEDAIGELLKLVKKICNSLNGTHVLITADHGFLYQRRPISDADKVPLPQGDDVVETNRRFILRTQNIEEPSLLNFTLPYESRGAIASVPRGSLRFSAQGGGAQYVHGGASLQEVCVPVITYHHKRAEKGDEGPARKVGVQINARLRRVTNNRFSFNLMQTDPVEGRWRSRRVSVALYDSQANPITDVKLVELGSSSSHPTDREFKQTLTVIMTNPPTTAALVVQDADDNTELVRETWTINLGITNDFGDF